jgi:hypothetical protein
MHAIVIYNKRKPQKTIEIFALGGENKLFERKISGEIDDGVEEVFIPCNELKCSKNSWISSMFIKGIMCCF